MSQHIYRIKKSFIFPLGINAALLLFLLGLSLFHKGSPIEKLLLALFFIMTLAVFLEGLNRSITAGDQGLTIRKFLKTKTLLWDNITHVGTMILRSRAYLLLTTTQGFYVLSNAYENYTGIIRVMADHLTAEKMEEDVRSQMTRPIVNRSDIVAAWFAVFVIAGIIYLKLPSF